MRVSSVLLPLAILLCLGVSFVTTQQLRDDREGRDDPSELMYFPSGQALRFMALGNTMLAADMVWMRAIQYYGEHRLTDGEYPHIGHVFDVATRLDPHFENAYLLGALILAVEGEDVDGAIRLMEQGLAHNPDSHLLAFELGFLYQVMLKDFEQAGRFYRRALRQPGCPEHVRRFAAFAMQKIDEVELSLQLWEDLAESSAHPAMRDVASRRAAEIREQLASEVAD